MAQREHIEPVYSRKVQLDQFEPIEFGAGSLVSLDEGDDAEEEFAKEMKVLEDVVERELARRIARKKQDAGAD